MAAKKYVPLTNFPRTDVYVLNARTSDQWHILHEAPSYMVAADCVNAICRAADCVRLSPESSTIDIFPQEVRDRLDSAFKRQWWVLYYPHSEDIVAFQTNYDGPFMSQDAAREYVEDFVRKKLHSEAKNRDRKRILDALKVKEQLEKDKDYQKYYESQIMSDWSDNWTQKEIEQKKSWWKDIISKKKESKGWK